jgi:hypothetical protein
MTALVRCLGVAVIGVSVWALPSRVAAQPTNEARGTLHWRADDPTRDVGEEHAAGSTKHGEQHPFVFTVDPSTPFGGELGLEYLVQGTSGVEATRPLAANLGAQGMVHGLMVRYGATGWLAPFATGLGSQPVDGEGAQVEGTGQAGVQFQLTNPGASFRAGLQTAFLREFGGTLGTFGRVVASYDIDRLRLAGNAHFEKVFADGRDGVDILAFAGASVRTTEALRLGAEYVGQDLEDAIEDEEAEGGARHFAAAVASLELAQGAFWVTGGPAFGLNKQSPAVMGRVTLVALF